MIYVSDLIEKLQKLHHDHGDLEVIMIIGGDTESSIDPDAIEFNNDGGEAVIIIEG